MKFYTKITPFIFALMLITVFTIAIKAAPLDVSIDFTGFTGSGFATGVGAPPAGQLDSDMWSTDGFSNNAAFETNCTSLDCARGTSAGNVATSGIYAFDIGSGDMILGVQPSGIDFTPGTLTLRMRNNTGSVINSIDVAYDIYYYNDQSRSNSLNFAYSTDGTNFTDVPSEDFLTPLAADGSPSWTLSAHSVTLSGFSVLDNDLFYIQW